jgi:hypothetical protein
MKERRFWWQDEGESAAAVQYAGEKKNATFGHVICILK